MDPLSAAFLVGAGVVAGLAGTIAGLASLASYPALLAVGLPPITANVTNTVAMFTHTVGAIGGSTRELRGQWPRLLRLIAIAVLGGGIGAALLLHTPPQTFEMIVPWLIAFGSALLLARDQLHRLTALRPGARSGSAMSPPLVVSVLLVGVYGGYFGAAAGIMMLAVLAMATREPLPITNAVKNVVSGAANITAGVTYALVAPVNWAAAGALALGCLIGAWIGPAVVRRLPERPLRYAIGLAGMGLAVHLFLSALS
jgi:uncharacterized protein